MAGNGDVSLQSAVFEVQKQQAESLVSMEALRKQHLDWEIAVKSMLQHLHDSCSAEVAKPPVLEAPSTIPAASGASPRPGRGSIVSGSVELQKLRGSTSSTSSIGMRKASKEALEEVSSADSSRQARLSPPSPTMARKRTSSHSKSIIEEALSTQPQQTSAKGKGPWEKRRQMLACIVESTTFECLTSIVILLNLILIGWEAELTVRGYQADWATQLEQAFLAVYTIELLMRFAVGGWPLFKSGWFLLDFFLVGVGLLALVVIPAIRTGQEGFERFLVVRGLRLLRLARVLRFVHRFKVVWRLVSGLLTAWDTMVSTTGLIVIWLYIFGCVALEFIATDKDLLSDPVTAGIVASNFGSLPQATLTLAQFVTMDAIASVYYPLVMKKPELFIYFLPLLMFLSIGLMNLVTAVLVEHALQHATQEAEHARLNQKQRIKATLPDLLEVFEGLDSDGSGSLTRQELADVPVSVLPPNVLENVSVDSMEDLFEMLDMDGGGTLTQDEFLEGLLSLLLLDVPIWAIQLQKQMVHLSKLVTARNHTIEDLLVMKSPGQKTAL